MDYKECPYRTPYHSVVDGMEMAICQLTSNYLGGQQQAYHSGICKACSEGKHPQSLKSPVLKDLLRRSCRRAFLINTERVGTTSPEIRKDYLRKLKLLGESAQSLERLLLTSASKGVVRKEEAATLYDEVHNGEIPVSEQD